MAACTYDIINSTNKANQATPHIGNLTDYDINSISHPYLRDIYSRLKEKYYSEDYAENRDKTKDYLSGFSEKIKEINSLPYQCQRDRLTEDTIDWYHADGYVYWDKDYTYAPREQDMQKAKADADDLREAIKQQNEYLNDLPEWAVPIAKKFSVEYDEGYKQLQQNSDDYKALDKMESAKIWGAKFKEKIGEIKKMTEENETHGNQLAWLTNMYYSSDEREKGKYAKWADELRENHLDYMETSYLPTNEGQLFYDNSRQESRDYRRISLPSRSNVVRTNITGNSTAPVKIFNHQTQTLDDITDVEFKGEGTQSGLYVNMYIDGFQTLKRLRANVLGDKNKIKFVFEKYLPDNMFELYKPGDILLRFEKEGDGLITHWNKLEPIIPTSAKSGTYFFLTESTHLKKGGIWHSY